MMASQTVERFYKAQIVAQYIIDNKICEAIISNQDSIFFSNKLLQQSVFALNPFFND